MNMERRRIKAVAGRKLACFAAAFSICLWAGCYGLPNGDSLYYGIAAAGMIFVLLWLMTGFRQAVAAVSLASFLSFAVFYFGVWQDYRSAASVDGEKGSFTVEVTQYPREGDYYTAIEGARLENGQRAAVLIYHTGIDLQPGDRLCIAARASLNRGEYFFSSMAESGFLTLRVSEYEIVRPEHVQLRYLPCKLSRVVRQEIIGRLFDGDEAALLSSLLTGGTDGMSRELKNDLSLSGTSHITSVSGLHMAVLSGAMIALFGRLWGAVAALPVMALFGMLTGMDPPVVRSILMLAMVFLAFMVDRENDGMTTVLTVLMLIAIADPCAMVSLSLQLSFAAVAGLLLFSDPIKRTLSCMLPMPWTEKRWIDRILTGFGVSIAASFATLPLTIQQFDRVSILSAVTNLTVLWLVSVLMLLGTGILFLWLILPGAAQAAAKLLLHPLLRLFMFPISFIAELSFSSVSTENRIAVALVFLWGILLVIGYRFRPRLRRAVFLLAVLFSLCCCMQSVQQQAKEMHCTIYADGMMTVQQGRAFCVFIPGNAAEESVDACEVRQYEAGRLKADSICFSSTVEAEIVDRFTAKQICMPGKIKSGQQRSFGDFSVTAYGPDSGPFGFLIEWQGYRILYACGTESGSKMPKGEVDLLILDESLISSARQRRRLFENVQPKQAVAVSSADNPYYQNYLSAFDGPTQWLEEETIYTYKVR